MTFLILRNEVSKMTWSIASRARSECLAEPAMVPGVEAVVGNVIVRLRSMLVVRIDW